jgi:hypothetical protein
MAHILDSGGHQLRGLFDLAQRCKPSGLSRKDFRANHAEAQAVRARLEPVPPSQRNAALAVRTDDFSAS